MTRPTQAEFLRNVAAHEMSIIHDDGLHRHLRFKATEHAWLRWFEVVTWPGVLCIRGDVGTYVFSRTADMFSFFRGPAKGSDLYINDSYWSEKLIASDCSGRRGDGVMRYDPDLFCAEVRCRYADHIRHHMSGMPDERRALRAALDEEVLAYAEAGETEARRAADAFEHEGFSLRDFWEVNCSEYTAQFIWSIYAIAWAIRQYDQHHSKQTSESASAV